jgi:hypothetical protein
MQQNPLFEAVLSPLDRVIAVGQTTESGGIVVELIAIEIRRAGAIASWRARPVHQLVLFDADVRVSDDTGHEYASHAAGREGSALHWSGISVFVPPPPDGARLTIEILSFGPPIDHEVPRGVSKYDAHVLGLADRRHGRSIHRRLSWAVFGWQRVVHREYRADSPWPRVEARDVLRAAF